MENIISLGRFDYFRVEDLKKKLLLFYVFSILKYVFQFQLVFGTPLHSTRFARSVPLRPKNQLKLKKFLKIEKTKKEIDFFF